MFFIFVTYFLHTPTKSAFEIIIKIYINYALCYYWYSGTQFFHILLQIHVHVIHFDFWFLEVVLDNVIWAASSDFGTYRICEQRRFRRACASCSLIQAVSQEEPSDRKPDPRPLWMAGHAQLKFVMTECSKTEIRMTRHIWLSSHLLRNFSTKEWGQLMRKCSCKINVRRRLRGAWASAQSDQSLCCSLTQYRELEKISDKEPQRWSSWVGAHTRVWRIICRTTLRDDPGETTQCHYIIGLNRFCMGTRWTHVNAPCDWRLRARFPCTL